MCVCKRVRFMHVNHWKSTGEKKLRLAKPGQARKSQGEIFKKEYQEQLCEYTPHQYQLNPLHSWELACMDRAKLVAIEREQFGD